MQLCPVHIHILFCLKLKPDKIKIIRIFLIEKSIRSLSNFWSKSVSNLPKSNDIIQFLNFVFFSKLCSFTVDSIFTKYIQKGQRYVLGKNDSNFSTNFRGSDIIVEGKMAD